MESKNLNDEGEWGWEDPIEEDNSAIHSQPPIVDSPRRESAESTGNGRENNTNNNSSNNNNGNGRYSNHKINSSTENLSRQNHTNIALKKGITSSPSFQELEKAIGAASIALSYGGSSDDLNVDATKVTYASNGYGMNSVAQHKIQQQRVRQKQQFQQYLNPIQTQMPYSPPYSMQSTRSELTNFINEQESRAIILFHSPNIPTSAVRDACQKFGVLYYIRPEFHSRGVTLMCYFDLRCAVQAKAKLTELLGDDADASAHFSIQLHASSNSSEEFRLLVRSVPEANSTDVEEVFARYGPIRSFEKVSASSSGGEEGEPQASYTVEFFNIQDARLAASELSASSNQIWGTNATITFAPLDQRKQSLCKLLLTTLSRWRSELASPQQYMQIASHNVFSHTQSQAVPLSYSVPMVKPPGQMEGGPQHHQQQQQQQQPINFLQPQQGGGGMVYGYSASSVAPVYPPQGQQVTYTVASDYRQPQQQSNVGHNGSAYIQYETKQPSSAYGGRMGGQPYVGANPPMRQQYTRPAETQMVYKVMPPANMSQMPKQANPNSYAVNPQSYGQQPLPQPTTAYSNFVADGSRPHHHNGGHGHGHRNARYGGRGGAPVPQTGGGPYPSNGPVGSEPSGEGEFALALDRIMAGADTRTTVMVRNIPNKYNQQMLLDEVNINHEGTYDFFYLPIDFKNKCNVGYCFINFLDPRQIIPFVQEFNGQRWKSFNSEKVCVISFARIQGKAAMVSRFQNSSLLEKDDEYQPLLFYSSGPDRGKQEPFPLQRQRQHPHQAGSTSPAPDGGGSSPALTMYSNHSHGHN